MGVDFPITSPIVVVSPGTGVLYTLAAGCRHGARASVVAAFGRMLGIVPHMAAAIIGLAARLHTSALAFQTLKYLGVACLLWMAWNTLEERSALQVETETGPRPAVQVIVSAILIDLLNPKLSIFFFAFLPAAVRERRRAASARPHARVQRGLPADDLRRLLESLELHPERRQLAMSPGKRGKCAQRRK